MILGATQALYILDLGSRVRLLLCVNNINIGTHDVDVANRQVQLRGQMFPAGYGA